jgi:hypothetical protein
MPAMTDTTIPHTSSNVIDARDRFRLFEAIPGLEFDWSADEWVGTHMPALRIAAATLRRNDRELQRTLREVEEVGELEALMEMLDQTQRHIAALDKMLAAAVARSIIVLERMGHGGGGR